MELTYDNTCDLSTVEVQVNVRLRIPEGWEFVRLDYDLMDGECYVMVWPDGLADVTDFPEDRWENPRAMRVIVKPCSL